MYISMSFVGMDIQHGCRQTALACTFSVVLDMRHGHGQLDIQDVHMQHGHGDAAWTWICSVDMYMDMQHEHEYKHGHTAWTGTCSMNMGLDNWTCSMYMGCSMAWTAAWHGLQHGMDCSMDIDIQHGHGHISMDMNLQHGLEYALLT
jgi:hypothetical protein